MNFEMAEGKFFRYQREENRLEIGRRRSEGDATLIWELS